MLEERAPVAPLGAAHDLLAAKLDLAAAGAREAEGGRRLVTTRDADHLDGRAERPETRDERAPDPLITVQQVARAAADVVGGGGDAVGQLALGAVMVDRAPARGASHETDAEPPAGDGVHVAVEGLAVAERDRRRRPREEAERRG